MNAAIRVLIVDDEPIAREILEGFVGMLPQLQLVASCPDAIAALRILNEQEVDLLLLDIDMPQINGLSFLSSLQTAPKVIFITAYQQYAIASYEVNAVDYLLKPLRFERFLKAINKIDQTSERIGMVSESSPLSSDLIFVKSEGRLIRIDLSDVLFIEGLKDYVALHRKSGKLVIHSTMKALEERLSGSASFLRIHKSYLVNLRYVQELDGITMRIADHVLSIGSTYRESVQMAFERYRL